MVATTSFGSQFSSQDLSSDLLAVGDETKMNALSKLLAKDTRLLALLEGCDGVGSQFHLWDADQSTLTSAPSWDGLAIAIAAVEQARVSTQTGS